MREVARKFVGASSDPSTVCPLCAQVSVSPAQTLRHLLETVLFHWTDPRLVGSSALAAVYLSNSSANGRTPADQFCPWHPPTHPPRYAESCSTSSRGCRYAPADLSSSPRFKFRKFREVREPRDGDAPFDALYDIDDAGPPPGHLCQSSCQISPWRSYARHVGSVDSPKALRP